MFMRYSLGIIFLCALALSGCSGNSSSSSGDGDSSAAVIDGSWSGSYVAPPASIEAPVAEASIIGSGLFKLFAGIPDPLEIWEEDFDFQITFVATGESLAGSYSDSKGRLGSVSGTLVGTTITATITFIDVAGSFDLDATVTVSESTGQGTAIIGTVDNHGAATIGEPQIVENVGTNLVGVWQVPDGAGTTDDLDRDGLVFEVTKSGNTWDLGTGFASYGMTWTYANGIMETINEGDDERITLELHPTNSALMIRKDYSPAASETLVRTINFIRVVAGLPTLNSDDTVLHNDLGAGDGAAETDIGAISAKKNGSILTITVATQAAPVVDESVMYLCKFYGDGDDHSLSAGLEYRSDNSIFYTDETYEDTHQTVAVPGTVSAIVSGNSIIFTFDLSVMNPVPSEGGIINVSTKGTGGGFPDLDNAMNLSVKFP